jgi:hypothetical protein
MMSLIMDAFHASQMKKPIPTPPMSISAATMASQESPIPMRRPEKIYGAAAGRVMLGEVLQAVEPDHPGDVSRSPRRDVSHPHGGIDDNGPHSRL